MTEDKPSEAATPKSRRKSVLVALGVGLIFMLVGLAWMLGLVPSGGRSPRNHGLQAASVRPTPEPAFVEVPEIMTNLDAGPHRIAFAKLQIRLETDQPGDVDKIKLAMPRIVDMAATYLRAVRPEELRGDTGPYLLREALLQRASVAVPNASVTNVLFEELIVQ